MAITNNWKKHLNQIGPAVLNWWINIYFSYHFCIYRFGIYMDINKQNIIKYINWLINIILNINWIWDGCNIIDRIGKYVVILDYYLLESCYFNSILIWWQKTCLSNREMCSFGSWIGVPCLVPYNALVELSWRMPHFFRLFLYLPLLL